MFAMAKRNRVAIPFARVEDVRAAYRFSNLQDFLDIYYQGANVLRESVDFYDLTAAYCQRAAEDGVRHAEVFFDPQTHTQRGIPMQSVVEGIASALDDARQRTGMTSRLILCFLRHLSEEDAFATLHAGEPYLDRIVGVGLDSSERGHPPEKFARVFARARAMGLKCVAHAGEEGPPEYVRQALDILAVDRLDHGNRAMEDGALVARLVETGMALTVCPLSNLMLKVVPRLGEHPLKRMLQAGLRVTVNSDDPAYFGGYVGANYIAIVEALGLDLDAVVRLAKNSFLGAFLPADDIARHLTDIDAFVAAQDEPAP